MRRFRMIVASLCALAIAGCNSTIADPSTQIGGSPTLPQVQHYLLPPMKIAKPQPWASGELPTVGPGLKVVALATGLSHPRSI